MGSTSVEPLNEWVKKRIELVTLVSFSFPPLISPSPLQGEMMCPRWCMLAVLSQLCWRIQLRSHSERGGLTCSHPLLTCKRSSGQAFTPPPLPSLWFITASKRRGKRGYLKNYGSAHTKHWILIQLELLLVIGAVKALVERLFN